MPIKNYAAISALLAIAAAPASAWAFTGVGGCSGLPEYYRALGALQGGMESACDMTAEEARRIVAAYDGPAKVYQASPAPRIRYRRHHARRPS